MAPQVLARRRSIASPQGTPVALPSPSCAACPDRAARKCRLYFLSASMPVKQFLKVGHFQSSPTESVPLTCVKAQPSVPVA
jgi:hypothetical protein